MCTFKILNIGSKESAHKISPSHRGTFLPTHRPDCFHTQLLSWWISKIYDTWGNPTYTIRVLVTIYKQNVILNPINKWQNSNFTMNGGDSNDKSNLDTSSLRSNFKHFLCHLHLHVQYVISLSIYMYICMYDSNKSNQAETENELTSCHGRPQLIILVVDSMIWHVAQFFWLTIYLMYG